MVRTINAQKIRIAALACCILLSVSVKGQFQFLDTISSSFHHKPKFLLDLGTYNSNVNEQHVLITDLSAGVVFNRRIYLSVGRSFLNTEVNTQLTAYNSAGAYSTLARLQLNMYIATAE